MSVNFRSGREPQKSAREPHKSAREKVQKNARERILLPVNFAQNVPVKIFEKVRFTGTFKVHGKKKQWFTP